MKKFSILVLLLFSVYLYAQSTPASLNECYKQLDALFEAEEIQKLIDSTNPKIMSEYHMSAGLNIRNNWIRNGNPNLPAQINYKPWKVGIDDLGAVVLTAYWYYLHNKVYDWSNDLDSAEKIYQTNQKKSEPAVKDTQRKK